MHHSPIGAKMPQGAAAKCCPGIRQEMLELGYFRHTCWHFDEFPLLDIGCSHDSGDEGAAEATRSQGALRSTCKTDAPGFNQNHGQKESSPISSVVTL